MKRTIALIALFVISIFCTEARSQSLAIGIEGGVNIANVSATPTFASNTRTGIIIGALLDVGFTPTIGLTTGLRYNMKGYSVTQGTQSVTVKLSYLEFPALLKVKFPLTEVKPYLIGGPVLGIQVAATQDFTDGTQTTNSDISSLIESIDFGLLFGGGIDFRVGPKAAIFVQPAYAFSLSNIIKNSTTQTTKNNGFQITGGVKFGL